MKTSHPFHRRTLLHALGLGAASLGVGTRRARAQAPIPKRLVVIAGDGMTYDDWRPVGVGGGAPTETDWAFGEVHKPLEPFRSQVLYVEGLGMVSEEIDPGPKGDAHQQGAKHALSAANSTNARYPGGPSIDQFVASKLNAPTPVTKFPSLQFAIIDWLNDLHNSLASAANTPLDPMWDPRRAYDRVFKDFRPPAAAGPAAPSMADIAREQQLAVLGFAKSEFSRMGGRLGALDRQRLDAHLGLLSDLEGRMKLVAPRPAGAGCSALAAPANLPRCVYTCFDDMPSRGDNYRLGEEINTRLAASALACDLTRVVAIAIGYGEGTYPMYGYTTGAFGTDSMHDLVHKVGDPQNPLSRNADARAIVKRQCLVEARTVAALLKQLAEIPEADGKSLLDHTVVLWGGHVGYGSHDLAQLPWVLIGSAGGYLRTGRYVKLPANPRSKRGVPHNDLFITLANAVGVATNVFGNPSLSSGPIAALRA